MVRDRVARGMQVCSRLEEDVEVAHLRVAPRRGEPTAVHEHRPLVAAVVSADDADDRQPVGSERRRKIERTADRQAEPVGEVVRDDHSPATLHLADGAIAACQNLAPELIRVGEPWTQCNDGDAGVAKLLSLQGTIGLNVSHSGYRAQDPPRCRR